MNYKSLLLVLATISFGCNEQHSLDVNKKIEIKYLTIDTINPLQSSMGRSNAIVTNYEGSLGKCKFGLIDLNENGNYFEEGVDAIEILPHNVKNYKGSQPLELLNRRNHFIINGHKIVLILDDQNNINVEEIEHSSDEEPNESIHKMISHLPDFEIELINGKTLKSSELRNGSRKTYVEFWGTWCIGCIQILPEIKELYKNHKDEVRIIGLAYKDQKSDVIEFMKKNNIQWEIAIIDDDIRTKFGQIGFPSGYLFDKKGQLLDFNFHPKEYKSIY